MMADARTTRLGTALVILSVGAAQAEDAYHFKDVLRPNGHERSLSAKLADGRSCGAKGGHFSGDPAPFEQCMRAHGWVVDRYTPDRKARVISGRSPSTYIDPDTGMSCRNFGAVAGCDPPQGTVHYRNEDGLNCTRTG